jgi:hypothetical protein
MASLVMINHLPELLLPQRLAQIRSVEMRWNVYPFRHAMPHDPPNSGLPAFLNLIEALPSTFPHIRKLFISIDDGAEPGMKLRPTISEAQNLNEPAIMQPVDDLVRRLGPDLQMFDFALPASLYRRIKMVATGKDLMRGWKSSGKRDRIWRELPEIEMGRHATHLPGYWVNSGQIDMLPLSPIPCFGGAPASYSDSG